MSKFQPTFADPEIIDARQAIRVQGGSLPENVRAAERVLAEATLHCPADGIYQRGGILVRTARLPVATDAGGIQRAAGSLMILNVGTDILRLKLTEAARWERFDKKSKKWVQTDAPSAVAQTLREAAGLWEFTPRLNGIIEAPSLRSDGSVLDRPGYDIQSGLYLDPGTTLFESIPSHPTLEAARTALEKLLAILEGFPFVDAASLSVAIALLIGSPIRHAVRSMPMTGITAPKPGSGKTLLASLAGYVATGRTPALISQAESPEEERKRLLALLLEGSAVTVIDNCERPITSDVLCTALTESEIRDRVLGSTRTVSVPTATVWICTGNNLRFDGDLSSRALLCRLDPKCERPEERSFARNLHEDVPLRRAELVTAALTICRAYIVAGYPVVNAPTFGRFEQWSRLVREPLIWLGMADPCETRKAVEAGNTERENLANLLDAWHQAFGSSQQTVVEVLKSLEPALLLADLEDLKASIAVVAEYRGKIDSRRFGNFISKYESRIEQGLRFERAGTKRHAILWTVQSNRDGES